MSIRNILSYNHWVQVSKRNPQVNLIKRDEVLSGDLTR